MNSERHLALLFIAALLSVCLRSSAYAAPVDNHRAAMERLKSLAEDKGLFYIRYADGQKRNYDIPVTQVLLLYAIQSQGNGDLIDIKSYMYYEGVETGVRRRASSEDTFECLSVDLSEVSNVDIVEEKAMHSVQPPEEWDFSRMRDALKNRKNGPLNIVKQQKKRLSSWINYHVSLQLKKPTRCRHINGGILRSEENRLVATLTFASREDANTARSIIETIANVNSRNGTSPPKVVVLDVVGEEPVVIASQLGFPVVSLDSNEFKKAMSELAKDAPPPRLLRELVRKEFSREVGGTSTRLYMTKKDPTSAKSAYEASKSSRRQPTADERRLTSDYLNWCRVEVLPGDCLHLLEEESFINENGRYNIAMAIAWTTLLREMLDAFKGMADPHAVVSAVLLACTTYMALLVVPEPISKGILVAVTATLIAYVGLPAFCNLITGFQRLKLETAGIRTFQELREAGERYGNVMGTSARAFTMIVMVAILAVGGGESSFVARIQRLPGRNVATEVAEAQGGFRLNAVDRIESVTVSDDAIEFKALPEAVAKPSQNGTSSVKADKARGQQTSSNPAAAIKSQRAQLAEHRQKLADYKANPDAFDNQGRLRNASSPQIRQKIIKTRIEHLEREIRTFEKNIRDLGGEP